MYTRISSIESCSYVNQNIEFKTNVNYRNFEIDCRIQLEVSELVTS